MLLRNHAPARPASIRNVGGLIQAGLASEADRAALDGVATRYATLIPPAFLSLIENEAAARAMMGPIARQVVPDPGELAEDPGALSDPIGDDEFSPLPGIVHRYADRALLKPLLVCPLYCRFCFRREHVGPGGGVLDDAALHAALDWLRATPAIGEVILTGGDPLMLSARRLRLIIAALDGIAHIHTIRIHSRVPVADPSRLDEAMAGAIDSEKSLWLVVHANHASEFTDDAKAAIRRVQARGVPVLGQSVLLAGVNDCVESLEALLRAMVAARIKPYYLHQLDRAPGTQRFEVPIERGLALMAALRGRVTGLAWPTYVLDIPGGHGKVPLGPDYLDLAARTVRDPTGRLHALAEPARTG